MLLKWIVMGLASALVLSFIWWRSRRKSFGSASPRALGRGVTDEAATAFEDVAEEFIIRKPTVRPESEAPAAYDNKEK